MNKTASDILVEEIMVRDVAYAALPGSRDEVLEILKTKHVSGVPVVRDGDLVGIVTRTDLLKNPEEEQTALLMTRDPITIELYESIVEASRLILDHSVRRLPVVRDRALVGLVTIADIVGAIARLNITDSISNYIGNNVVAVWSETPLSVVRDIMELADVKAVPVLGMNRELLGVVSDKDLIAASLIEDRVEKSDMSAASDDDAWTWESMRDTMSLYYSVSRIMLPNFPVREAILGESVTAVLSSQVSDCARKMRRNKLDQIPVILNRTLIGLLRDRDLLKALI